MKLSKWQKNNIKNIPISDLIAIKSELEKINRVEYYPNYQLVCKDADVIDALIKSERFHYISVQNRYTKAFFVHPFTCPQFISVGNRLYKY